LNQLAQLLPQIVPLAIEWAERVSAQAASTAPGLTDQWKLVAQRAGVRDVDRVRVAVPEQLPFPEHPLLQQAALTTGLLGPNMAGLTLGHTIFVRSGQMSVRLLSHELRHVAQYEAAGSIGGFLPGYLAQIVHFGYEDAPLEVDARSHEIAD
jgi:hypothetical protein